MRAAKSAPLLICGGSGGGNTGPAEFAMDFLLGARAAASWTDCSNLKESRPASLSLSLERKHTWCGFVSYKGTHSSSLNRFGDGIIWSSPPIQYLRLEEYFKNGFCPGKQARLPFGRLLTACHF